MTCEQATAQTLRDSGHRLTPQRLMILSAVRHAGGHVSAAAVIGQVRQSYPYVDASTVYRTLSVLKEMRLISETRMGGSESRYEWIEQVRHHHLICRVCDRATQLDHRYMTDLWTALRGDYGFEADLDHFAIIGVCAGCLAGSGE